MAGVKNGRDLQPPPGTYSLSQCSPSVYIAKPRNPRPSPEVFASRTIAPAPSPKSTARSRMPVASAYQRGSHGPGRLSEHDVPHGLGPRHEPAVHFGPDEEDAVVHARADEGVGRLQAGQEARALHPDVERVRRLQPEVARDEAAVAREVMVGGHRRRDDEVDVGGGEPRVEERGLGGLHADLGGSDSRLDEVPLLDAGARHDPLVVRVHDPAHHLVRHDLRRDVHPGALDHGRAVFFRRRRQIFHAAESTGGFRQLPPGGAGRRGGSGQSRCPSHSARIASLAELNALTIEPPDRPAVRSPTRKRPGNDVS